MKRAAFCLLLALALLLPLAAAAQETPASAPETQFPIYVDGVPVADAHTILQDGVTYVSAYHLARALWPETTVAWDGVGEMVLSAPGYTLSAQYGRPYVVCNGRYLYTPGQVRLHPDNGDLLLPVRVVARALGGTLGWDPYGVYIATGCLPLESGETFYDADQVSLMARTICHEAGTQPLEGQIAVGNVLLNRVRSASFPNTLYDVIYQKGQFSSSERSVPKETHFIAAKLALEGAAVVPESCCWFNAAGKSFWGSKNRSLLCVLGSQAFYG